MIFRARDLFPKFEYPSVKEFNSGITRRWRRENDFALIRLEIALKTVIQSLWTLFFLFSWATSFENPASRLITSVFSLVLVFSTRFQIYRLRDKLDMEIVREVLEE